MSASCLEVDEGSVYWTVDTAFDAPDSDEAVSIDTDIYSWRRGLGRPVRLFHRRAPSVSSLHVSNRRIVWSEKDTSWRIAMLGSKTVHALPFKSAFDIALGRDFVAWVSDSGEVFAAEFSGHGTALGNAVSLSSMKGGGRSDTNENRIQPLSTDGHRIAWVGPHSIYTWAPADQVVAAVDLGPGSSPARCAVDGTRLLWTVGRLTDYSSEDIGVATCRIGESDITTLAGPLTATSVVSLSVGGGRVAWAEESNLEYYGIDDQAPPSRVFTWAAGDATPTLVRQEEAEFDATVFVRTFGIVHRTDYGVQVLHQR